MESFQTQLIKATWWSGFTQLFSSVIPVLIFIVLARILTPDDFGVVAVALLVTNFAQLFWEAGLGRALINIKGNFQEIFNVVFWINLSLAIIMSMIIIGVSPVIADLFDDRRIEKVLSIQSIGIILSSLGWAHLSLIQKRLDFKKLFYIRITASIVSGVIAIPLAINGFGYWALVGGSLMSFLLISVGSWRFSGFKPQFQFKTKVARKVYDYAFWIHIEGFLLWFFLWGDAFFVGKLLGTTCLGLFKTANSFVSMIFGMVVSSIFQILFPAFSKIKDDPELLANLYLKSTKIFVYLSIPLGFLIWQLKDIIEDLIFNETWTNIGLIIGILAIGASINAVIGANAELLRAIGRPDVNTKIKAFLLPIYVIAYYFSLKNGLLTFLWIKVSLFLLTIPFNLIISQIVIGISVKKVLSEIKWSIFSGLIIYLTTLLLSNFFPGITENPGVIILTTASLVFFFGILYLFDRDFLINTGNKMIKKNPFVRDENQI